MSCQSSTFQGSCVNMSGNEEKMSVPYLGEQTRAAHFPIYLVKIDLGSLHPRRGVSRQITDLLHLISPLLRLMWILERVEAGRHGRIRLVWRQTSHLYHHSKHQSFRRWGNFSCMLDHRLAHAGVVSSGEADPKSCSRTRQARDSHAPALVLGRQVIAP